MPRKSLVKKEEGKRKKAKPKELGKGLAFLLAFVSANGCIWIIQQLTTPNLPPIFIIGWLIIYTLVLYKKFKNSTLNIKDEEIKNTFK